MTNPPEIDHKGEIRYINKVFDDGWVSPKDSTETSLPLCMYTKVSMIKTKLGWTTFKVLDGPYAGQTLKFGEANAKIYLGKTAPAIGGAKVIITYGKYVQGWASEARN